MKLYDTEIIINGRKLSSLEATVVMEALKDSADNGVFNDYTQYELVKTRQQKSYNNLLNLINRYFRKGKNWRKLK